MSSAPFFKGLSLLVLLNMLIKPVWIFAIDRQIQNVAGHEAYGNYFSILALSVVLSFLTDAGLTNTLNRQLALKKTAGINRFIQLKLVLSIFYLALLIAIAYVSGIRRWDILLLTGVLQVLTSFLVFYRNVLTGHQLFKKDAWLSITDKAIVILVCGLWLYAPLGMGIMSIIDFLYVQITATAIAIAWAIIVSRPFHKKQISALSLKQVFVRTAPFIILILLMGFHSRIDAFLLERIHSNGAYEAGLYAAAYRLLDAANTAGYMAASFLVPFAARNLRQPALIAETVLRLRHFLLGGAIVLVGFTAVYSEDIMKLLYHRSDHRHATVLMYCIAVLPAYYLIHIYGSLLTAKGRFTVFIGIIAISVLCNLLINLTLIPAYGALACCMAALASQYLAAFSCFYFGNKAFTIPVHRGSLLIYLLTGILILAIFTFIGVGLWAGFAILSAFAVAALLMFVIIQKNKLLKSLF